VHAAVAGGLVLAVDGAAACGGEAEGGGALEFQVDSDLCGGRGSWLCFLCALNGLV
jgi:hypothetical protein